MMESKSIHLLRSQVCRTELDYIIYDLVKRRKSNESNTRNVVDIDVFRTNIVLLRASNEPNVNGLQRYVPFFNGYHALIFSLAIAKRVIISCASHLTVIEQINNNSNNNNANNRNRRGCFSCLLGSTGNRKHHLKKSKTVTNEYDKIHQLAVHAFGDENDESDREFRKQKRNNKSSIADTKYKKNGKHIIIDKVENKTSNSQNYKSTGKESNIARSLTKDNNNTNVHEFKELVEHGIPYINFKQLQHERHKKSKTDDTTNAEYPSSETDSSESETDDATEISEPKVRRHSKAVKAEHPAFGFKMRPSESRQEDDKQRSAERRHRHVRWKSPRQSADDENQNWKNGNEEILAKCKIFPTDDSDVKTMNQSGNKNKHISFCLVKKKNSTDQSPELRYRDRTGMENCKIPLHYPEGMYDGVYDTKNVKSRKHHEHRQSRANDTNHVSSHECQPQCMPTMVDNPSMHCFNPADPNTAAYQVPSCAYQAVMNRPMNPLASYVIPVPSCNIPQCNTAMVCCPVASQSCNMQPQPQPQCGMRQR